MFICVLLLRATGASWVPFLAVPGVIAGLSLSILMVVAGVTGLLARQRRPIAITQRTRTLVQFTSSPILNVLRR